MKKFKMVCNTCGSENVSIWNYYNENEEGIRLICNKCGESEKW